MICSRVLLRRDVILTHRTLYGLLEFSAQPVFSSQVTYSLSAELKAWSLCLLASLEVVLISSFPARWIRPHLQPWWLHVFLNNTSSINGLFVLVLPAALRARSRWGRRRRRSGRWSHRKWEQCAGSRTRLQPGLPGFSECPGLSKPGSRRPWYTFKIEVYHIYVGFPGGANSIEHPPPPPCQCRRCKRSGLNSWVGKIPWRRTWQPTWVFLLGESHGQRSLAAIVHRVTQSQTQLKQLCTYT